MPNKINLLRFLIVVLFLSTIAIATETTWRHSGFEISGYDINGSSTYNLTEIRKIEFGWNSAVPAVSETSRAVMYYDDNQKRIMQSVNGGAYQAIVTNTTVDFQTGNASNLTTGVLPNVSIPSSAANLSANNAFTGTGNTSFVGNVGIGNTTPGDKLVVKSSGTAGDGIKVQHSDATEIIDMGGEADGDSYMYLRNSSGTDKVLLYSNGDNYFNGGNVGIGTTGPVNKLDVRGGGVFVQGTPVNPGGGTKGLIIGYNTTGNYATIDSGVWGTSNSDIRVGTDYGVGNFIIQGNAGIGNTTPLNVLAFAVGSTTDPVADSWLQYSTPGSKIVLGEADNLTEKYRADFRNTTVYRWKRTINEPERLGVLAKEGTPSEILAYHDGKNNTNSTALNTTPQGIDLGAYIGWLHEIIKGQDMQLQKQEQRIATLEVRVQKLENNYLNLTKP